MKKEIGSTKKSSPSSESPLNPEKPIQLKRILVPLDFSDASRKALQYALAFGKQFDAELSLVHIVPNVTSETRLAYDMPELQRSLLKEGEEKMQEEVQRFAPPPMKVKLLVKPGVPWNEIVELAAQMNIDLVILGTHGRTGIKHALLGSTAERVARHAPCPVLVVREREHEFV